MSTPLFPGFVAGSDPTKPNLAVCTLCGGQIPRTTQHMEQHPHTAKHQAAINRQQQQQQAAQQAAHPAAAAAAPSSIVSTSDAAVDDAELAMQLLAQKQRHAMQKLMMEQELEQIRLKQLLMEKKQREEQAAIEAKLAGLKLQRSQPNSHSGAAAAASSPPVTTPPRAAPAAAASSSLSLTPNPAQRVSAPIAPASAPAARPVTSASASAVAPSGRFAKPGLYYPVLFGVLTHWKSKTMGAIEVPSAHGIDGQTLFPFHVNQAAAGVERDLLPIGSHVQFQIWVVVKDGVIKRYASCVKPANEGQTAALVQPKYCMEPISLERWHRDDAAAPISASSSQLLSDGQNGLWELEVVLREFMKSTGETSFQSSRIAHPLRLRFPYVADKLYPGDWVPLWQLADKVRLAALEAKLSATGCTYNWLRPLFDVTSPMRFPQPTHAAQHGESALNGASSSYASPPPKTHGAGVAGAGVALTPLATPTRVVHKSSTPGGPASPDPSPSVASPDAVAPSAVSHVDQLAEVQRALASLIASTGKEMFDFGEIVPRITLRNPQFKASLGEGGWGDLWKRAVEAGVAELVTWIGPMGTNIYRLKLKPMRGELAELYATLEAMAAQMGGDAFDVGSVAQWLSKRLPLFKQSLPDSSWMGLWKRADAAGVVKLEITQSRTGADCYRLWPAPELKELRIVMELIAVQSGSDSIDQASVAEWLLKRNAQLKAQLGGAWMTLWKRGEAAGVIKLEPRASGAGITHYSLRRIREPQPLPSQSAAATTPHKAEASPASSSQSVAAASSSSAQTPLVAASRPQASSPAVESAQAAEASDPSDDLAQLRLRRQQRLEEAMRREEELMRQEEEALMSQQRCTAAGQAESGADEKAAAEAEARRVEQEQAEIEAAFAELSSPGAAPPAPVAPLTQWTSLASSLAAQPIASAPVAASASSSSSSSPPVPAGLLRGTFLRWYDETFCAVSHQGTDLLCHADQILCEVSDLTRGCAVQFVLHRGKDRDYAEEVQPLGWSRTVGLEPGCTRGVIARWIDDTHGLIRARVHGMQREMILFHIEQCGAMTKDQLPEHTKVAFKPFVSPNNGKTFANDVRPIKAAADKETHRDNEQTEGDEGAS